MSDEKKMTAAEAWAEYDRLDKEHDDALIAEQDARRKSDALWRRWANARDRAADIGPRPEVLPVRSCPHRACDGSGRAATTDGNWQLCMCQLVPS